MANKFITSFSETGFTFKGHSYNFTTRINSSLDELDRWAEPQINSNLEARHLLTKREWTAEVETYNDQPDNFGVNITPLSDGDKIIIRKNAEKAEQKLKEPCHTMMFDKNLVPFAYRNKTTGPWLYIMGSIDGWKDITYSSLADVVNKAHKTKETEKFIWKIGDTLFSDTSTSMCESISALVTEKYLDKFIPHTLQDMKAITKVTKEGFSFIVYFLAKYLNQDLTKYNISTSYERLNKIHAIPFVPTSWQSEIELLNTERLEKIAMNLSEEVQVATEEDKILQAMQDIKDRIENSLEATNDTNNWLKLSDILDIRFDIRNAHELWNDEFMIEIDEEIEARDLRIPEDKILMGLFSWGVLELLVEDELFDDHDLDTIETELEIEHNVPVSILTISSDKGQELLERVTNDDAEKT